MTRRRLTCQVVVSILFSLLLLLSALYPTSTHGYVYWNSQGFDVENEEEAPGISRANLDGTGIQPNHTSLGNSVGPIAVNSNYQYWVNYENNSIGRADLDGTNVHSEYIKNVLEESQISGLAVNDEFIYFAVMSDSKIGRVKVDGSELNKSFITGLYSLRRRLAIDASHLYWNDFDTKTGKEDIGRSKFNGAEIEPAFIPGFEGINALAVNSNYVYTATSWPVRIARANKEKNAEIDGDFIMGFRNIPFVESIAANDSHLYWSERGREFSNDDSIGRANTDGTNVRHFFICHGLGQSLGNETFGQLADYSIALDQGNTESEEGSPLTCLLEERVPQVRLDSQESYHPDAVELMTNNWGDEELGFHEYQAEGEHYSNKLLYMNDELTAWSSPHEASAQETLKLNLFFLGDEYGVEEEASSDDWIDARNDHYAEDAQRGEAHSVWYDNQIYGHVAIDSEGQIWLQYWLFYYYNSFSFEGIGVHEGDWEMIQIRLDEAYMPQEVVLAQHDSQSACEWEQMEVGHTETFEETEGPVIYPGLGSHASFPHGGKWELPSAAPEFDSVDGEGMQLLPYLNVVGQEESDWPDWPGHWGNSRAGSIPGEANSPQGPKYHSQWTDPLSFAEGADDCYERFIGPLEFKAASKNQMSSELMAKVRLLDVRHQNDGHPLISYKISNFPSAAQKKEKLRLILSLEKDGDRLSPRSWSVKEIAKRGVLRTPFRIQDRGDYRVLASLRIKGQDRRSPVSMSVR